MFLRRRIGHCMALLAMLFAVNSSAAAQVPEHDLKAAFIYNFIQFTQWPARVSSGAEISLCASRGSALFVALEAISGKVANGRIIVLRALGDIRPELCQVLVATGEDRSRIVALLDAIAGRPVLTVTDDAEVMRAGMMIGMAVSGSKMSFIADNSRAGRAGLTLSSRLLRLASSVQ